MMRATAVRLVQQLRDAGYLAYFAGGCVRDLVRGVEPHDYDIATAAPPAEIQRIFPRTVPVGAQFGVVLVLEDGYSFEVATFRSDESYADGRRPTAVRYATSEADAQRRDFTINGLFYDPLREEVIDYVGGRADIAAQVVRCIGEPAQRFTEDKLRLLRAVRFAANLGYTIESATWSAMVAMADQVSVVSAERVRDELIKTFRRPGAGRGLELLEASGLLRVVLPEVAALRGVEQPPQFHPEGDVFTHVRLMLDALPPNPDVTLVFAVLLHDIGKPATFQRGPDRIRFNEHDKVGAEMTARVLRRLRFSNEQIEQITVLVRDHMRFQHAQEMRLAKLKRWVARPTFPLELELHRLDCLASHGKLDNYEFLRAKAIELPAEVARPVPLLTGDDLLALGFRAGPRVGQVLQEAEELQLEERLKSREEALAWARQRLRELPDAGTV